MADRSADFVPGIYDVVLGEDDWPSALRKVLVAIDADSGCICWKRSTTSPLAEIASVGMDVSDYLNRYGGDLGRIGIPFFNLFQTSPTEKLTALGKRAFDPEYQRSAYFNEWAKPQGFGDLAGSHLIRDTALYGWFSIRRDYGKGPFPDEKLALGNVLMPHLARALKLWARFRSVRTVNASLAATLDLLTSSVFIVDAEAKLLYANRSAERLLSRPGPLFALRGRIACQRHEQNKALLQAIRDAALRAVVAQPTAISGAIVLPADQRGSLAIQVVPIASASSWGDVAPDAAVAALFVADSAAAASLPIDAFAARHGLTRMETRVLAEIISGEGLRHVAEALNIGTTTARSHLQKLFLKTGASKQAELVRLFFDQTAPISQSKLR